MAIAKVAGFSISLDGFGAGADQGTEFPLGRGGEDLHCWMAATGIWGDLPEGVKRDEGINDLFLKTRNINVGATIMGRNMYGPVRGNWDPSNEWRGWWGENPPYHHPVFVLTHHPHNPIEMEGGTTFHFVTDGIESAHRRALEAANGKDVIIGGGSATIQQFMNAGLVDKLHVAIAPLLLGAGEPLFANLDPGTLERYEVTSTSTSNNVVHIQMSLKS